MNKKIKEHKLTIKSGKNEPVNKAAGIKQIKQNKKLFNFLK